MNNNFKKPLPILWCFTLLSFFSCTKNEDSTNISLTKESPKEVISKMVNQFDDEMAKFKSETEFYEFNKLFYQLSDDDRMTILKSLKFETRRELIDKAYAGLENLTTRDEYIAYLSNYQDLLKLQMRSDGDEEIVEIGNSNHAVRPFLNGNNLVKIGSKFVKYIEDYRILSDKAESLLSINDIEVAKRNGLEVEIVSQDIESGNRDDFNVAYNQEIVNDNSGCSGDRKLKFFLRMKRNNFVSNGINVVEAIRECEAEASKKGVVCIWYNYSTLFTWNNCNLSGVFTPGNVITSFTPANATQTTSIFDRTAFILQMPQTSPALQFTWTTKTSSITHQGMAGAYITL